YRRSDADGCANRSRHRIIDAARGKSDSTVLHGCGMGRSHDRLAAGPCAIALLRRAVARAGPQPHYLADRTARDRRHQLYAIDVIQQGAALLAASGNVATGG